MEAQNKLQEAQYFLRELSNASQDTDEFIYKMSAFLSAWRSVFDILLYDYAEKFSLGLTREDKISDYQFEIAIKAFKRYASVRAAKALKFLHWWRQKRSELAQNPLWKTRTIIVHRGYPPTMRVIRLYIAESLAFSSTLSVSGTPTPNAIPTDYASPAPPSTQTSTRRVIETRFKDFPNNSILDTCEQAFNLMKKIVEEAKRSFG